MDTSTGQVFQATQDDIRALNRILGPNPTSLDAIAKAYVDHDDTATVEAQRENMVIARFVELPSKPLPECPTCRGKGTMKSWGTAWAFGACPTCYPEHAQKARTFKRYIASGFRMAKQ